MYVRAIQNQDFQAFLTDNPYTQILLINQIIGHKKINKLMPHTNLRVKGLPVFTVIIIFHQQLV